MSLVCTLTFGIKRHVNQLLIEMLHGPLRLTINGFCIVDNTMLGSVTVANNQLLPK